MFNKNIYFVMSDAISKRENFSLIYKLIKDNADIPFKPEQFIEKAKMFSIPIFNRLLLLFTFLKLCTMHFYFIFWEKSLLNGTIICGFILTFLCLVIMFYHKIKKLKLFSFLNLFDEYVTLRILRVIYILIFFFEENRTIYLYKEFNFQINPGFIFTICISIFFFESQNFSGALLYLYIVNMLSFVYYFSIRNCLNFYLPINIVIGGFVLVNVVAHNIGRKLSKSELFISFYEKVLDILAKEIKVNIVYDNQIIFPHEKNRPRTGKGDDIGELQSISSMDNDGLSTLTDKDVKRITINEFEGFEVAYNKQEVGLRKMSFMNK